LLALAVGFQVEVGFLTQHTAPVDAAYAEACTVTVDVLQQGKRWAALVGRL
jgi:hypothetical protein